MVRKSLKIKLGIHNKAKRSRENDRAEQMDENQNNPKKTKEDELKNYNNKLAALFEDKFNDVLNRAIAIFKDRISVSLEEKLAYYQILKRITSATTWRNKKIVGSNKFQLQCIAKEVNSEKDKRDLMMSMEKFVEYKIKSFPGYSINSRVYSIAKHYQNELAVNGITLEKLKCAIDNLEKATGKQEAKSQKNTVKIINLYENICRLCGSKRKLISKITDLIGGEPLKDIVSHFCRVTIQESNNLPQLVCQRCINHIEGLNNFSKKIASFQQELQKNLNNLIPLDNIKYEDSSDYDEFGSDVVSNQDENSIQDVFKIKNNRNNFYDEQFEIMNSTHSTIEEGVLDEMEHDSIDACVDQEHNTGSDHESNASSGFGSHEDIQTSSSIPPCHVLLEKLPIEYVPSDNEDSSENVIDISSRRSTRGRISSGLEIDFELIFKSNPNLTSKTVRDAFCMPIQEVRVKEENSTRKLMTRSSLTSHNEIPV